VRGESLVPVGGVTYPVAVEADTNFDTNAEDGTETSRDKQKGGPWI
jgi:hypothetical protein